jgi:predicted dehydrogenase
MSRIAGSEPIRALIVGCGAIAGGYDEAAPDSPRILTHAKAYARHPRFAIVGCVEPDGEKRARFQRTWNIPKGFAALDQVDVDYDVASVCVPTPFHAETLESLLRGPARLVFAEKPLTDDLARSRAIVEAYGAAGKPLAVNYLRRWAPGLATLKADIAAGRLGRFIKGSAWYTKGLLNNGSHFLDLAAFLLGDLRPGARLGGIDDGRAEDPTLDVMLRTGDGAPLYLLAANARAFTIFEADLLFAEARIRLTDSGFCLLRQTVTRSERFDGYSVLGPAEDGDSGLGQAMLDAVDNIARHLTDGTPLVSTGRSALAAQDLCAALAALPETTS